MFRNILLPTDGSPSSEAAMRKGIQLAKTVNARVTGFCVAPALRYFGYDAEIGTEFKKLAETAVQAEVNKNLLAIEKAAKEAGVLCETSQGKSDQPYEAIIEAAQKMECDLIIMASHGRGGRAGSAARQRDSKSADPFQDSGVGVPVSGFKIIRR